MSTIINRNDDQSFYVNPDGITIMGRTKLYKKYNDMINDLHPAKFAWCLDASADPTVNSGAAFYIRKDSKWQKLYESEAMDNVSTPNGYDELLQTVTSILQEIENLPDFSIMSSHINDIDIHITPSERNIWNNKVDKVPGKQLSSNDFTDSDKIKLINLENYNDRNLKDQIQNLSESKFNITDAIELQNRISITEQLLNTYSIKISNINEKIDNLTEIVTNVKTMVESNQSLLQTLKERISILEDEVLGSSTIVTEIAGVVGNVTD